MDLVAEAFEGMLDAAARDEGDVALHRVSAAQDCQASHGLTVRAYGRAGAPVRAAFQVAAQLHALPDHLGKQLYAATDTLRLNEREVESHVVLARPWRAPVEPFARNVRDVLGDGTREHRGRIKIRGERG